MKSILIENAVYSRAGSTAISISTAVGLSMWANKKVLLIGTDGSIEDILTDVACEYSLDMIRVLNDEERIFPVNTVNPKLDFIGAFKIRENIDDKEALNETIKKLLIMAEEYDFAIIDGSNFLLSSFGHFDIIYPVLEADRHMLHKYSYEPSDNIIPVFNKINIGIRNDKCISDISREHGISRFMPVIHDANVFYNIGIARKSELYSFLISNIDSEDNFINDILDICFNTLVFCGFAFDNDERRKPELTKKIGRLFKVRGDADCGDKSGESSENILG